MKHCPAGPPTVFREESNGAAGNAFDAQGRLYTCETHARRVTRTDKKGRIEVLADKWDGKRLNAPNDLAVSKSGHVYFTDPAFGSQQDTRANSISTAFTTSRQRPVVRRSRSRRAVPMASRSRRTGAILYVANSDERNIRAYDVDRDGAVSNERVIVSKVSTAVPNGMRIAPNGDLYVAAKSVAVYSPEGKLMSTHSGCRDALQLHIRRLRPANALHHRQDVGLSRAGGGGARGFKRDLKSPAR